MKTPSYIKSLLAPATNGKAGKRVWSIDLEATWLPFFTATNVQGDTAIPADALGAPIRLAYAGDGAVKFNKKGRPVTVVVKEIRDAVTLVRENFAAQLNSYAASVARDNPDAYKAQVKAALKAGEPITVKDKAKLADAMRAQMDAAIAEAEAKANAKAEAEGGGASDTGETGAEGAPAKELVTA